MIVQCVIDRTSSDPRRSEKMWDLLVVSDDTLHIALEFKSQVGPSFGNNFNNRMEKALGNAMDLRRALTGASATRCSPNYPSPPRVFDASQGLSLLPHKESGRTV